MLVSAGGFGECWMLGVGGCDGISEYSVGVCWWI